MECESNEPIQLDKRSMPNEAREMTNTWKLKLLLANHTLGEEGRKTGNKLILIKPTACLASGDDEYPV
jgi:hypothetical protein